MLPEETLQQLKEANKPAYGITGTHGLFTPEQTADLGLTWSPQYRGSGYSYDAGEGSGSVNPNPLRSDPRVWEALAPFGITEQSLIDPNRQSNVSRGGFDRAMYLQDTGGYNQDAFRQAMEKAGLRWEEANKDDWTFNRLMQGDKQLGDATAVYNPDTGMVAPLSIMLMAVPGAGQVLGAALGASGTAATVLGNALISGTMSELGGGDFLKGAVTGAAGAGLGSFASPYIGELASSVSESLGGGTLGDIAGRAVSGAGSSALNAAVRGQDIVDALLSGGLSGAAGGVSSELMGQVDLPAPVERVLGNALTSGMLGQDVQQSVINSLLSEGRNAVTQGAQPATGGTTAAPSTGPAPSSDDFDWSSLYNTPSELPGYTDPDGFYVRPTEIAPADQTAFPAQDFGTAPRSDINAVYDRISNELGGFASTWQTVGSDRVMVQDDGSAIGISTETGETYALTPEETTQMVDLGLLNTATSGYQEAIQGTGGTPVRGTTPTRGTTPARPTSAGAGQSSDDLMALLAMLTAMGGREEAPEQYQLANVAPGVQAGLRAIDEMYGTNRG